MSGFFDDLVAATTADGPLDALISDNGPLDRQAVRTAGVLASAAVVSELARLADGGGRWTWQRLVRSGAAGAGDPADPVRNESLTRMLFGDRVGQVAEVVGRDAALAPAEAQRVLGIATGAAASLLGERVAAGDQPDLRAEAEALAATGWSDWLAALAPEPAHDEPPADDDAPADDYAPAEPIADEAHPLVLLGPDDGPPLAPAAPSAAAIAGREDQREAAGGDRPGRRLLVTGVVTVVAAALVALAVSTRFGGDVIDSGAAITTSTTVSSSGATAGASPAEAGSPDGTADRAAGSTEPAPAAPAAAASLGATPSALGDGAPVGPTTYRLALADPQGSTDAAGTVRFDLDPAGGRVCYQFEVAGLTDPFPGHIHAAPSGTSGGITVDFGYLTGSNPSGCVDSFPADVTDLIRHPERHYVELHDIEHGFGIRSRLAEEPPGAAAPGSTPASGTADSGSDPAAVTVLSGGRVVLRGEVPDEAARSALVAGTADLASRGVEVVDELTVRAGAPAPSGRVVVDEPLLFPFDSNRLPDDAARSVDQLARILQLRPQWRVTLVGNTDGVGDIVYNLTLSLRRAIAARNALVAAGVAPEAVTIRGDGPFAPVADNDTLDGRTRNRRIDVVVATTP